MRNIFKKGDQKIYKKIVTEADTAAFETGAVHPVYSTFAMARDAEWACRLFVLEMKEAHEEGIGTYISVEHLAPVAVGTEVEFIAAVEEIEGISIMCNFTAKAGGKLVAKGKQGQKILPKEKIKEIFEKAGVKNG